MLREGAYGTYHQAQQATHTGTPQKRCAPLEFTHIMIDEAGQVSYLLGLCQSHVLSVHIMAWGTVWLTWSICSVCK